MVVFIMPVTVHEESKLSMVQATFKCGCLSKWRFVDIKYTK